MTSRGEAEADHNANCFVDDCFDLLVNDFDEERCALGLDGVNLELALARPVWVDAAAAAAVKHEAVCELVDEILEDVLCEELARGKGTNILRWTNPNSVLRTLSLIEEIFLITSEESAPVSLRGLYYRMAPIFKDEAAMTSTLKRVTNRLQLDKEQLGIIPAAKGMIFGAIEIDEELCCIQQMFIDQYLAQSANLKLRARARVLIVEKHSVFDSLMRTSFAELGVSLDFESLVLVTGRGFPDMATLRFLERLSSSVGETQFDYLGDYDPYGLQICLNYRRVIPELRWIGITAEQIGDLGDEALMPLTHRDAVLLNNLLHRNQTERDELFAQAYAMSLTGRKCEIEALPTTSLIKIIISS